MHLPSNGLSAAVKLLSALLIFFVKVLLVDSNRTTLPNTRKDIEFHLKGASIIPDVLDKTPKYALEVDYKLGSVRFGNLLTVPQTRPQPVTLRWPCENSAYYTLIMTDADAGTTNNKFRQIYSEWQHWLVGNIPGSSFLAGESLTPYMGSGPPSWLEIKEGIHRYVFIIFRQPEGKIYFTEPRLPALFDARRTNFSTRYFARKYGLGDPLAVNFFRTIIKKPAGKRW